jgi:hypothetical protein
MIVGEFYINPSTLEIVQVLDEAYLGEREQDTGVRVKVVMSDRKYALGGVCGIGKDYFSYWNKL